jgi:hypothetical protein
MLIKNCKFRDESFQGVDVICFRTSVFTIKCHVNLISSKKIRMWFKKLKIGASVVSNSQTYLIFNSTFLVIIIFLHKMYYTRIMRYTKFKHIHRKRFNEKRRHKCHCHVFYVCKCFFCVSYLL